MRRSSCSDAHYACHASTGIKHQLRHNSCNAALRAGSRGTPKVIDDLIPLSRAVMMHETTLTHGSLDSKWHEACTATTTTAVMPRRKPPQRAQLRVMTILYDCIAVLMHTTTWTHDSFDPKEHEGRFAADTSAMMSRRKPPQRAQLQALTVSTDCHKA